MPKRHPARKAANEHTLSEMAQELSTLTLSSREARRRAVDALAQSWFERHDDLAPLLDEWSHEVDAHWYLSFALLDEAFNHCDTLSAGQAPHVESPILPNQWKSHFDSCFGPNTALLVGLTLTSLEMQIDFPKGHIAIPVVMAEGPCGMILAHIPGLTPAQYEPLCNRTTTLMNDLRHTVLSAVPNLGLQQSRAS